MPVVMGTAGHIDHGKTSLIKALTGTDCDRLAEEKKRGITIELGFAFLDFDDGSGVSIVDVPGHEKFVKNMVAGAAGIDFVLLVIAADEGVMPQTREHMEICSLLGIEKGIVALTKIDTVDDDWLDLVKEDLNDFLESSFLSDSPVIPVSSYTGKGLKELKTELKKITSDFVPKRRSDLARLPIDRVFTIKGHGTVVTGTLISGQFHIGEDIMVFPDLKTTKVRSLQSHGKSVETAPAGRRTAVNLHGLEVDDLSRGDVLGRPNTLFPSFVWDIELTCLTSSPLPLKHRKEVHFHHGSKEVQAKIYFPDRDKLLPGERCVCQARFDQPMIGIYGDRVVLRSFSPLRTIAGGSIINPAGRKLKRFSEDVKKIENLIGAEPESLILTQLELSGSQGLSFAEISILTNLASKPLEKMLQSLGGKQTIFLFDKDLRQFIHGKFYDEISSEFIAYLKNFHDLNPMKIGVTRSEAASSWGKNIPFKLLHFVVEKLIKQNDIISENDLLRLPEHRVSLASDQHELREKLFEIYDQGSLTPPNLKDVMDSLSITFKEASPVFKLLQDEGMIVRIKEDMYFSAKAVDDLKVKLKEYFAANEELGPQDFKELVGLSRKYSIPLLEYMDREKFTIRVGDKRVLRKQN